VHGALPITYGKSPYPITSFDGTSAIIRKEIIEDFKNFLISFCEINIFLVDYTFLFLKKIFFFFFSFTNKKILRWWLGWFAINYVGDGPEERVLAQLCRNLHFRATTYIYSFGKT